MLCNKVLESILSLSEDRKRQKIVDATQRCVIIKTCSSKGFMEYNFMQLFFLNIDKYGPVLMGFSHPGAN